MPSNTRQSNFELLRCVCMLMVLNLHSFWGYESESGPLQALDFLRESFSICAVDCFILISGYFSIKWKWNSFFNLVFQVFFYAFVIYFFCVFFRISEFEKSQFLECFKSLYKFWGFISYYFILYFISPLLNAFAEKTNNKNLLLYIFVLFFAENFILRPVEGPLNFCLLYLIGRWLSKTAMINKITFSPLKGYVLTSVLIFIIVYLLYLILHLNAEQINKLIIGYSYSSPFVILQAIFLFLVFGRLKIQNKFINWCAVSCLSVFLIHMHPTIKYIGYYSFTRNLYQKNFFEHGFMLLALIIAVFFASIFIDKMRIIISLLCKKIIETLFSWVGPLTNHLLSKFEDDENATENR